MTTRSYSELRRIHGIEGRYEYLALRGQVGRPTFGSERYMNQKFYRSAEWKRIRNHVVIRDDGCDLGVKGHEIHEAIIIHHMNPMTVNDLKNSVLENMLDPEFLVCCTLRTHNAIHYGNGSQILRLPPERTTGDTKLW